MDIDHENTCFDRIRVLQKMCRSSDQLIESYESKNECYDCARLLTIYCTLDGVHSNPRLEVAFEIIFDPHLFTKKIEYRPPNIIEEC